MKNDCGKYKDLLLDAALAGCAPDVLEAHLKNCADCTEEFAKLRARREKMDAFLPLLARGEEPSTAFRAQVLAAAEAKIKRGRWNSWRAGVLAVATTMIVAALVAGWIFEQKKERLALESDIAAAEKLSEWRAPSDVLLEIPGREILRTTPKLGESYLKTGAKKNQEE